jgi:arylsulfatase A-like enzyme
MSNSRFRKKQFLLVTVISSLTLLGLLANGCARKQEKRDSFRPNIIFIMSDDHAYQAISSYGSNINQTPNIDRIANEGMIFNNCFSTNSICTPSRASILTGKYSHKNKVYHLGNALPDDQKTFPEILQQNGYYTGMIGKWHLHTEPKGFDYWKVLMGQGEYHDPSYCEKGTGWGWDNLKDYKGYVTDISTNFAFDFLNNRPEDKPFCMLLHYKAPHDDWLNAKKYDTLYKNTTIPEPLTLFDDYSGRANAIKNCTEKIGENHTYYPEETGQLEDSSRKKAQYQFFIKKYLRCVASVDENIGRVLNYLDENDLTENTIIVYTSDQGVFLGEHGLYDKRFMYEESLRMPFIVRYPKEVEAKSSNNDIITNIDFAETFLDFSGVSIPSDMQGRSIRPLLQCKTPDDWRQSMYYRYWMHGSHFNVPAHYGIRTKNYKLIYYYGCMLEEGKHNDVVYQVAGSPMRLINDHTIQPSSPEWELFDLRKDPTEMKNVYPDPEYKEIIKGLKSQLLDLKEYYGDTDQKNPEMNEINKYYWKGNSPSIPAGLQYDKISNGNIILSWDSSYNKKDVIMYSIFQDKKEIATISENSLVINNLSCDKTYYFTVKAASTKNSESLLSEPLKVNACFSPKKWKKVDDAHPSFKYSSGWEFVKPMDCYMNSAHVTHSKGSEISFSFYGEGIRIYMVTEPENGDFEVLIDGKSFARVKTNSPGSQWRGDQLVYEYTGLNSEKHTLRIISGNGAVFFDALGYYSE